MNLPKSPSTSEEDLADASRKLQALVGTIAGTKATSDAVALKRRLTKLVRNEQLEKWAPWGSNPGHRD